MMKLTSIKIGAALLALILFLPHNAALALSDGSAKTETGQRELIPLGLTAGVKLKSDGLIVVNIAKVDTDDGVFAPASDCGLIDGDVITHVDTTKLEKIEDLQNILQECGGKDIELSFRREGRPIKTKITPALCSDGLYKLGLLLRDSMAGIGTLTYYNPRSGGFGALGHGINDIDTFQLMPLSSGSIIKSKVTEVKKGHPGTPGELLGEFTPHEDIGTITANSETGIFGFLTNPDISKGIAPMPIAAASEIKVGPAKILSNVSGCLVEPFDVEITRIFPGAYSGSRNMMIEIKDSKLLDLTGGIVQGMSGSPIIQNGKLVGAVTHVLVNNPQKGYGIFIENMLNATESIENSRDIYKRAS